MKPVALNSSSDVRDATPRMLIVDDELLIRTIFSKIFEREGFQVDCAADIATSEEYISRKKYDLAVVDIHLGQDDGMELLQRIRKYDAAIHIILVTGKPDVESAAEAVRLGAFDYLTKPLFTPKVISTVNRALRSKRLLDDNLRKQANLDAIFQSVSEGIILVDHDSRLLQVNGAAIDICGYGPQHVGAPLSSIDSGCVGVCRNTLAAVLCDGMPHSASRIECSRAGKVRTISVSASPVKTDGSISGAVAIVRDESQLAFLEKQLNLQNRHGGIIGKNGAMQRMYTLIDALAEVQTTVLINGESGTGKELVAAALHGQGIRRDKPFVKVNCSALSENLLESELFGHVRGAFTGAISDKTGRFQKAHGGTIFLDEIGDISPAMQMRLLRVLQEQEFERVGDSATIRVDVRVIAATNQDLAEKVRQGTFRQDLFYRLNVVRLVVPPLRDRSDDIPLLVEHFLDKFSRKFKKQLSAVSGEVMKLFMGHSWPGNVRELEHVIEHAAVLSPSSMISEAYLPQDLVAAVSNRPHQAFAAALPNRLLSLAEALEKAGGNKAKAARLLGVSRCTLYRKLQEEPTSSVKH